MRTTSHVMDRADRLDVKMTPMIDVVFLLLVFFVWTASFRAVEYSLGTSLLSPAGQGIEAEIDPRLVDLERVVIRIHWQQDRPVWFVNEGHMAELSSVRATLATISAINSAVPVVVDAQPDVPLGHVIDVYDIARQEGFVKVQFVAMEIPPA